ncbi:hypothetical protein [Streptacidiphilus cavernicola]|uniref:Uncharacterized protein n=1 Tax=Streptacidiphilus cavernicola TaxID=3342716 RepID=A0ABV6VY76_9ACTN
MPELELRRTAYHERVYPGDGQPFTQRITAQHADALVARAVRLRCPVRVSVTGTVTIVREHVGRAARTITLEPLVRPSELTERQDLDLRIVAAAPARLVADRHGILRIRAGLAEIPPAASWRLLDRGWLACLRREGDPCTVSVAGRIALEHRALKAEGARPTFGAGLRRWEARLLAAATGHELAPGHTVV